MIDHKMVQVNAAQRSHGTTSHFTVDFQTRDLDKVVKVTMIKATLPRMFFNIQSWNNKINIIHSGSDNVFTIPVGQYTATTLNTALNTATAPIFTTWVYNATTSRFEATYSSVTTVTLDSTSSIAPYIGLTANTLTATSQFSDLLIGADIYTATVTSKNQI